MTRISVDVGAQIFEYMKESGINQRQLAERLGKRESEISKWLNGSHNFTIETIAKIEDTFDKDIVLVPMFAINDLDYKHQVNISDYSSINNLNTDRLWGVGIKDLEDFSNKESYSSGTLTLVSSYLKTG